MGIQSEEGQRMGERVAYYQAASQWLEKCQKLGKVCDPKDKNGMLNALKFAGNLKIFFKNTAEKLFLEKISFLSVTGDVNKAKLEHSLKENEFVFHEKVPELDSLPSLKGASLVKGIGFEITDEEVSGPDIFERIVPMEALEASSMYR